MVVDKFKSNKFPFFLPNFQFPQDFELYFLEQIQFETCLNFKGVQIFWEKSHKFTKLLASYDFHEYEFRWHHLYSKN
jgi:hypothetical protein